MLQKRKRINELENTISELEKELEKESWQY